MKIIALIFWFAFRIHEKAVRIVFQQALKFSEQLYQLGKFPKIFELIENRIPKKLESVEFFK